jgi:hypothetical protein
MHPGLHLMMLQQPKGDCPITALWSEADTLNAAVAGNCSPEFLDIK